MKKKTRRRITDSGPTMQRRLQLARETVRTLGPEDLSQAAGGSDCVTTSWTTEKNKTDHH
jgi:hypothetical protein